MVFSLFVVCLFEGARKKKKKEKKEKRKKTYSGEVDPKEESQVRLLEGRVDCGVAENLEDVVHAEDVLAHGFDEAVLTLGTGRKGLCLVEMI